jgi:hypothetical protein
VLASAVKIDEFLYVDIGWSQTIGVSVHDAGATTTDFGRSARWLLLVCSLIMGVWMLFALIMCGAGSAGQSRW